MKLAGYLQEAKVLMAVINHPNVVQFHGACLRDNLAMIVLEYMEVRDITLRSAHCEVMLVTTMLVVMRLSSAAHFHDTCLLDKLAQSLWSTWRHMTSP